MPCFKQRITIVDCNKSFQVLFQDTKTLMILNFYVSVMPIMKSYVVLFQSKEPLLHLLNDKQEEVFRQFLSCFVKQEHVFGKTGKQLKNIDLASDNGQFLNDDDMFVGRKTKELMKADPKDPVTTEFKNMVSAAYITTGSYLTVVLTYLNHGQEHVFQK